MNIFSKFAKMGNTEMIRMLAVQERQLARWEERLVPAYYDALKKRVEYENSCLNEDSEPSTVFRGTSMENFVANYTLNDNPLNTYC